MTRRPKSPSVRAEILDLLAKVPVSRVVSPERLADELAIAPSLVVTTLAQLSEDERERVPWHRVVAKGGAIGRGLHRDRQFAVLIREGVPVSPAGIVQDLGNRMFDDFAGASASKSVSASSSAEVAQPLSPHRSRGMKSHR